MEILYELNLAKREASLYIPDVLGMEHTDAPNSYLRSVDRTELIPRLLRDAPDTLWMAQTTLCEHGEALQLHGPRQYQTVLRLAAVQAFLAHRRRTGLKYSLKYVQRRKLDIMFFPTLVIGAISPKALAYSILAYRRLRTTLNVASSPRISEDETLP